MVDTNRPEAFDVIDTKTGRAIGRYQTHKDAIETCAVLEPEDSGFNHLGWRYVIEPVRTCALPPTQRQEAE